MELNQLVEQAFQDSINTKIDCVELVTPALVSASMALTECLLNDGKILVCATGASALNAQFFASILMNQGERERPALPAVMLDHSYGTLASVENDYGVSDVFARQVHALGQPGDVLVVFTRLGVQSNIVNAVTAAHERDMKVVALTSHGGGHIASLMSEGDIEIRLPENSRFRIYENQMLLSFVLCELIENQLFGGMS